MAVWAAIQVVGIDSALPRLDVQLYLLRGLAPGIYEVRFEAAGFKLAVIVGVPVYSSNLAQVDAKLEVGSVSEAVEVSSDVSRLMTESSALATVERARPVLPGAGASRQIATPRLREYFPETLLWQPQIETDKQGRPGPEQGPLQQCGRGHGARAPRQRRQQLLPRPARRRREGGGGRQREARAAR